MQDESMNPSSRSGPGVNPTTLRGIARTFRNSALQIDTLVVVGHVDYATLRRLPCIGDAMTVDEIKRLADDPDELSLLANGLRAFATTYEQEADDAAE